MNKIRRTVIQLVIVLFIVIISGCSSTPSKLTPTIKPLDTTTPNPTVVARQENTLFTVSAQDARVRKFPNISSSIIFYLEEGQLLVAHCGLGSDGNWCQVTLDDRTRGSTYPKSSMVIAEDFPTKQVQIINSLPVPNFTLRPLAQTVIGETGWIWGGCLGMGSDCK